MSDISEECHCAGWLGGTEYLVPELCRRAVAQQRPQRWGHGEISPQRAEQIVALAEQLGHWAVLDERGVGYVAFAPFPTPPQHRAELATDEPRSGGRRR